MPAKQPPQQLIEIVRELDTRGLNRGSSGNCSVRLSQNKYLITPSGVPSDSVTPRMLIIGEVDGEEPPVCESLRASSEWRFHRDVYRNRPEIGAVVHVHSIYATSLSCLRRSIPAFHYMVAVAGGTDIRCTAYATYGTAELSSNVIDALRDRTACLLANHGLITIGETLREAINLCIEVEALAQQYAVALAIGEPKCLDDKEMFDVLCKFSTYRKQKNLETT